MIVLQGVAMTTYVPSMATFNPDRPREEHALAGY